MPHWTTANIPDQTGKRAIVTGSTGGTGYETALELARKGAEIVIAARNPAKGEDAVRRIRRAVPTAQVRFEALDLADQASVVAFADRMLATGRPIDILVNNAGVMALPTREVTGDGFEMQLATNYLGHFALTARLLPLLTAGRARVVQLSSIAHRRGRIRFDDLNHATGYRAWPVYAQSKLAMLMFGLELDRRSAANGWGLTSVVAHPGYARTGLIANGPLVRAPFQRAVMAVILRPLIEPLISHSAAAGALPILMAATDPSVAGGAYVGATRLMELKGPPGPAKAEPQALDTAAAARLWEATEAMLGVRFPI
ncbi:SDR family oxidoreductase [Brevundimonas sp. AJA228-03]|uniref:SDR family oxidoreductase n=1 Tax=Brevundimonas sp. AJA228-03 TaxID=2752515 RepID=UPI001ADFF058|nr:SDR family oxidoreductase [Brevundimonas sp. AJA228-03]QTN19077.1 SDR family oxidoreductase [Brevundimonas sp. AJA228-03]